MAVKPERFTRPANRYNAVFDEVDRSVNGASGIDRLCGIEQAREYQKGRKYGIGFD
jgi:hypothetical protein